MVELELLLRRPPRIGIYVAREHRRAPEVGLKTLTTGAFAHSEASIELFEGFGFEVWARFPRVADLDGVERGLVVMDLRLGGPGPKAQPG